MSKILIVDDADPAVTYTGSWTTQAFVWSNSNEFASTVHKSGASGDQLSYTFTGTGISVYGTIDTPATNGLPSATFSIDGQPATALNATNSLVIDNRAIVTSHALLFKSQSLAKGSHTLTVKTGTPANATANFYVDYFAVSTGADSAGGNILVDDRDASIVYSGPWLDNGITAEYLGTTRQSPAATNGGSATFRFNGTGITIFGTTASSTGASSVAQIGFDIDGVRNNTFTGPENSPAVLHTPFFKVDGLANDKEHTVVMNTLSPNVWFLDFMVYKTENSAVAGGGSGSNGGNGGTSTGAIVGGVIAAIVGILALIGIIFILVRRRKANRKDQFDHEGLRGGGTPGPMPIPFTTEDTYTHGNPQMQTNPYISTGGNGSIPASKDARGGGSANHLLTRPPSSFIGGGSSVYTGVAPEESQYADGSIPGTLPNASPPARSTGHANTSYNHPLYPQFDAGSARVASTHHSSSHTGSHSNQSRITTQPISEKARYMHAHNQSNATQAPRTFEEDSGIRIPAVSPPLYTAD